MRCQITPIAYIHSPFGSKFGIPRQSGLTPSVVSQIVMERPYAQPEAVRGLAAFSHLWLIWGFSEHRESGWHPTVRPPRLGGNRRVGVFATRSPFRPNGLGLSLVTLRDVRQDPALGVVLEVSGADLLDGTPIFDIKPYLEADCVPGARFGFTEGLTDVRLEVVFPETLRSRVPASLQAGLTEVLSRDPRPAYQEEPGRVYGLQFGGQEVRFTVEDGRLTVVAVGPVDPKKPVGPGE